MIESNFLIRFCATLTGACSRILRSDGIGLTLLGLFDHDVRVARAALVKVRALSIYASDLPKDTAQCEHDTHRSFIGDDPSSQERTNDHDQACLQMANDSALYRPRTANDEELAHVNHRGK